MKKTVLIFFHFFLFIQIVVGQNRIFYELGKTVLSIDFQTNEYHIWKDNNTDPNSDWVLEKTDISEGKILVNDNIITCTDMVTDVKVSLRKIDEYRLVIENKSSCFNINDTLYASVISDQNGRPYQWMKWKDGKRHGEWIIHSEKGVNSTLYKDGKIIRQCFKTDKEFMEERLNAPIDLSEKP